MADNLTNSFSKMKFNAEAEEFVPSWLKKTPAPAPAAAPAPAPVAAQLLQLKNQLQLKSQLQLSKSQRFNLQLLKKKQSLSHPLQRIQDLQLFTILRMNSQLKDLILKISKFQKI